MSSTAAAPLANGAADAEWLLLGCESSGKTALSRCLLSLSLGQSPPEDALATAPTNGVERSSLQLRAAGNENRRVVLREVGGALSSTWSSYLSSAGGLLFVLDLSAPWALPRAQFELANVLASQALGEKVPLVLVLHKCDAPGALPAARVSEALRLRELISSPRPRDKSDASQPSSAPQRKVHIVETSAAKERGLDELLRIISTPLQQQ